MKRVATAIRAGVASLSTLVLLLETGLATANELLPKDVKLPLSSIQIVSISSNLINGGWENFSPTQTSSQLDHGGSFMRIVTEEIGYGRRPTATFNGRDLPVPAEYMSVYLCRGDGGRLTTCTPGKVIVGMRRYWKLDGQQAGEFYIQNRSAIPPIRTAHDRIYIR